jgi:redox-sensitive bicupin YhaK (pirin superfamily)
MPIKILKIKEQNNILINNGEIEENKAVGMSTNKKSIMPYSSIFNFSNQWTDIGSRITEHTHKGFDILTISIKGSIDHYYPEFDKHITISSGDVEYIQAGYGIKHEEIHNKNAQSIQIWLDPNLRQSLAKKPKIQHVDTSEFPTRNIPGITKNFIIGDESPLEILTPDVELIDYKFSPGLHNFKVYDHLYFSFYVIKGEVEIEGKNYREDTFFVVKDEMGFTFYANAHTRILLLKTKAVPEYKTYLQLKAGQ